jgi:hypothetical protein
MSSCRAMSVTRTGSDASVSTSRIWTVTSTLFTRAEPKSSSALSLSLVIGAS